MSILGLDIGTTNCKGTVFSFDRDPGGGAIIARAEREYPLIHPHPDWAELDSRVVIAAAREVMRELAGKARADPVAAISVCSMGEAMTPVSRDGRILGNAIIHLDSRGREQIEAFYARIDKEDLFDINPNIHGTNYSLPKLLWRKDNEPELFASVWKFLLFDELLLFMMGLEPLTSYSLANRTMLFDIREEGWSDRLLALAGMEAGILGTPVASGTIAGELGARAAEEFGLERGVICVVGAHDQCCNALGAGVISAGKAVCGIGTVECITPVYDRIPNSSFMLANGLNVEHHALSGLYVSFIYNQAGSLVRWFRDTFARADWQLMTAGEDIYDVLVREMPDEPTGLLTLPYFEMTGPPEFVTDGTGVIAGLRTSTPRGEILKSILEGVTFYFVESIQALREMGIDTSEFIATGGGARTGRWLQIKADIFGIPFVRPRITEGSVVGAAILAGAATGVFADAAEGVAKCVQREKVFRPDPARHRIYVEQYEKYRRLRALMRGLPDAAEGGVGRT